MTRPSRRPFRAIIFDADGTLGDTERTTLDVLYQQACLDGFSMEKAQADRHFRGRRMALCISDIEAHMGRALPSDLMETVRQTMTRRFEQGVCLMPGAQESVHAAKAMGQTTQQCCVVEDSLPGVQAGLAAGMQVFYVGDPDVLPRALVSDVSVLDGLAALQALIERQSVSC